MRFFAPASFILLAVSLDALAQPNADRITTRQTGDDSYEITLESKSVLDESSAIRRIVPTAFELCAGRFVEPGTYTFDMTQAITGDDGVDRFRLVHNVRCVDERPEPPPRRAPQLEDEEAIEAVKLRVSELSAAYFEHLYSSLGDDANAALAAIKGDRNADSSAIFDTAVPTPIFINLYRLTVYDNLPSAPADGVYVAVDYDNRVGNVAHHCGYLMWHSSDTQEFSLGRVESGTIDNDTIASISDEEAGIVRKQLRCSNFYDD